MRAPARAELHQSTCRCRPGPCDDVHGSLVERRSAADPRLSRSSCSCRPGSTRTAPIRSRHVPADRGRVRGRGGDAPARVRGRRRRSGWCWKAGTRGGAGRVDGRARAGARGRPVPPPPTWTCIRWRRRPAPGAWWPLSSGRCGCRRPQRRCRRARRSPQTGCRIGRRTTRSRASATKSSEFEPTSRSSFTTLGGVVGGRFGGLGGEYDGQRLAGGYDATFALVVGSGVVVGSGSWWARGSPDRWPPGVIASGVAVRRPA
jgi:hypothetical protein